MIFASKKGIFGLPEDVDVDGISQSERKAGEESVLAKTGGTQKIMSCCFKIRHSFYNFTTVTSLTQIPYSRSLATDIRRCVFFYEMYNSFICV